MFVEDAMQNWRSCRISLFLFDFFDFSYRLTTSRVSSFVPTIKLKIFALTFLNSKKNIISCRKLTWKDMMRVDRCRGGTAQDVHNYLKYSLTELIKSCFKDLHSYNSQITTYYSLAVRVLPGSQ